MQMQSRRTEEENQALRREIASKGLRLEDVWAPNPRDPDDENRRLMKLTGWMRAYFVCPRRRELERMGYQFPPVDPTFDPDTDWARFERWINREPVSWSFVREFGEVANPADLTDAQLLAELDRIRSLLARRSVLLGIPDEVPPRLVLQYLRAFLADAMFDFAGQGSHWHVDGCGGCCPECFQRPWCEAGSSSCWPEDEKAGFMVLPEMCAPFVSLRVTLQELQDAEAGWM